MKLTTKSTTKQDRDIELYNVRRCNKIKNLKN